MSRLERPLGPLGRRLALAFVAVALAAVAVFGAVILLVERADVANLADDQQDQTTADIATALIQAYQPTGGWVGANLSAVVALADAADAAVMVETPDGHIAARAGPQNLFHQSHTARTEHALTSASGPVGTLRVAFAAGGLNTAERHLRSTLSAAVGWTAGLVALVALAVAVLVARGLVRPIRRLSTAARALERGQSETRVGAPTAPGELGELARAFDSMADSLEREDRLRRALVADVAHELRTPVAVLQAETEALLDGVTTPSTTALSSLHDETVRLGRLVEDLQTLASAEAAGLHLERRPLDLARVAGDAADSLASRFGAAGVRLEQELPPTPALGDPRRLHQVAANLLANAVKFTPVGGLVTVTVASEPPDAVLEVADTGPGITADEQPLIWERFYRGQAGRATSGSGIGLAVVKEIVEAHGGTVHLYSSPGEGARFVIRLPQPAAVDP
jgi:two-component system sensor histidine kinase BaeS